MNRICLALEQAGIDVSRRTVYRVMKENGWLHKRRVPHGITRAATEAQEQENLRAEQIRMAKIADRIYTRAVYIGWDVC